MGFSLGGALGAIGGAIAGGPMLGPISGLVGGLTGNPLGTFNLKSALGTEGYNPNFDPYAAQQQVQLAEYMKKRAMGEMPSYAETATRNALQENLAAQQAGIRSIGGVSGALKQRMMANAAAKSGSEMARRGGEAALQERNEALGQYGTVLNDIRGGGQKEEAMRQGAFEDKQKGKRQLWTAAGQGLGSALAKK